MKACFKRLGQINYRNHMKIALVDGEVVYTGGMNMGQEYIDGGRRFARWRDTHVRLTGPIAAPFAILFAALWRLNGGREDLAAGYLPRAGVGPARRPLCPCRSCTPASRPRSSRSATPSSWRCWRRASPSGSRRPTSSRTSPFSTPCARRPWRAPTCAS